MLWKAELANEALQAEIRDLKLDNVSIESTKAKAEEESTQLKINFKLKLVSPKRRKNLKYLPKISGWQVFLRVRVLYEKTQDYK